MTNKIFIIVKNVFVFILFEKQKKIVHILHVFVSIQMSLRRSMIFFCFYTYHTRITVIIVSRTFIDAYVYKATYKVIMI